MILKHSFLSSYSRRHGRRGSKTDAKETIQNAIKHVSYIAKRPGMDKDDKERAFFTDDRQNVPAVEVRQRLYEIEGRRVVVHKLMFSADIEMQDDRDHMQYVRLAMFKLGREKGLDLEGSWFASIHKNTDHPHVHLVLLGTDANGRQIKIDKNDHRQMKDVVDRFLDWKYPKERLEKQVERNNRSPAKGRVYQLMLDREKTLAKDIQDRQTLKDGGTWSFSLDEKNYSYSYDTKTDEVRTMRGVFQQATELRKHNRRLKDLERLHKNKFGGSDELKTKLLQGSWSFRLGDKEMDYSHKTSLEDIKSMRQDIAVSLSERDSLREHEQRLRDIDRLQRSARIDLRLEEQERPWLLRPWRGLLSPTKGTDPSRQSTMWVDQATGGTSGGISERQMPVGELTKATVGFAANNDASEVEPLTEQKEETVSEKFLNTSRDETWCRLLNRLEELVDKDKLLSMVRRNFKDKDNKEGERAVNTTLDAIKEAELLAEKEKQEKEKREREQKRKPREVDIFDWDDPDWE
ncbi:MAG: relaxase MobL [Candidatus Obscuribacterales bacterium]|nr:relaxase MobL [Candidatus Obscuribacterales bacterium]